MCPLQGPLQVTALVVKEEQGYPFLGRQEDFRVGDKELSPFGLDLEAVQMTEKEVSTLLCQRI